MKLLSPSLINVLIILTVFNQFNFDQQSGQTPYSLKLKKDTEKKNWTFGYDQRRPLHFTPAYRLSTNPEKAHNTESFGCNFVISTDENERIEIQFRFNVDSTLYSEKNRPVINSLDELQRRLKIGEWSFNETEPEFINVMYRKDRALWLSPRKNATRDNPNYFLLEKVTPFDDPKFGPGLMVSGRFQILLNPYYGKNPNVRLEKAKFRGFVKILRK